MCIKTVGAAFFDKVRSKCPLIHHITNYVTVNDCANIVLAIGASPVMADDIKEAASITALADALVLNIGTLNQRTIASMIAAGRQANDKGIPVVLDPVGAGASAFRNETVKLLLQEIRPAIIRGNLSELSYIAGLSSSTRGVDSNAADTINDAAIVAKKVAQKYDCVAAVTGVVDTITDGQKIIRLYNGHKLLASITGTGCMTSSLTAAFAAVAGKDMLSAAVCGIAAMGISGEVAYETAGGSGLGSFHVALFDAMSRLNGVIFGERVNYDEADA